MFNLLFFKILKNIENFKILPKKDLNLALPDNQNKWSLYLTKKGQLNSGMDNS